MIALYLCAAFSFLYLSIIAFLFRGLLSLKKGDRPNNCKFTVVIAARNEEKNLHECLNSVLCQTIGSARYEVILVNDRSKDATLAIGNAWAQKVPNLTVLSITETPYGVSPKKHAVMTGIKTSKNSIIVCTDADCIVPQTWLETIDAYFTDNVGLVQGITSYERPTGMNPFFFGLQAVDFCSHGVVSAAAIGANVPINSNANNFAFRKKAFEDAGGYGVHSAVISGDDDMLLQRIANKTHWRIRYMPDTRGAVTTQPTKTPQAVAEQRKRWGSKTIHYGHLQICMLTAIFAFYCSILGMFGWEVFNLNGFRLCAMMFIVKIIGELLLMIPGTKMMRQTHLRKFLIVASVIQLPMVVWAVFSGVFGKFSWKDQEFKRKIG